MLITHDFDRPFPYHSYNATKTFSDVADSEGSRLQPLFEKWAQSA